jgi:hypothetical protein
MMNIEQTAEEVRQQIKTLINSPKGKFRGNERLLF